MQGPMHPKDIFLTYIFGIPWIGFEYKEGNNRPTPVNLKPLVNKHNEFWCSQAEILYTYHAVHFRSLLPPFWIFGQNVVIVITFEIYNIPR